MHDHCDDHGQHHHHDDVFHTHAPAGKMKKAFFLTLVILVVEVIGGLFSHSLALLSDAGHVLTDIAAIGLSWYAITQSLKPADAKMTFGYHRSGILAALINGVSLMVITLVILWEAFSRLHRPPTVATTWMLVSPAVGLLVNLYLGLGMRHEENINVRSAVLHMLGDAAASAGVIVGGIVIAVTGWNIIDPILSVGIALLISYGAWKIVKQTVAILMEGTPKGIESEQVLEVMRSIPGVQDIHDIHIWSITSGRNALSCHVVMDGDVTIRDSQNTLRAVERKLIHLGIGHVTIQTEDTSHPHDTSLWCTDEETSG